MRSGPRTFYQYYNDTFNYLSKHKTPSLINVTVDAHFGGRFLISAMLSEILQYTRGFFGVRLARRDEVASWVLDQR